jgi:hypothetical protein
MPKDWVSQGPRNRGDRSCWKPFTRMQAPYPTGHLPGGLILVRQLSPHCVHATAVGIRGVQDQVATGQTGEGILRGRAKKDPGEGKSRWPELQVGPLSHSACSEVGTRSGRRGRWTHPPACPPICPPDPHTPALSHLVHTCTLPHNQHMGSGVHLKLSLFCFPDMRRTCCHSSSWNWPVLTP